MANKLAINLDLEVLKFSPNNLFRAKQVSQKSCYSILQMFSAKHLLNQMK